MGADMTLRRRLQKLEAVATRRPWAAGEPQRLTDEEWLAEFEDWGQHGLLEAEPDFAVALAAYRHALAQAAVPPEPPAEFLPDWARRPRHRLLAWQDQQRSAEMDSAWSWLADMVLRATEGMPPLTQA